MTTGHHCHFCLLSLKSSRMHASQQAGTAQTGVLGGEGAGIPHNFTELPHRHLYFLRFLCTVGTFITWYPCTQVAYPMFSFKLCYFHISYVFREFDGSYCQSERRGPLKLLAPFPVGTLAAFTAPQHFFPGAIYGCKHRYFMVHHFVRQRALKVCKQNPSHAQVVPYKMFVYSYATSPL